MDKIKLIIVVGLVALLIGLLSGAVFFYWQDRSIKKPANYFFIDPDLAKRINSPAQTCLKNNGNRFDIIGGIVNHHLLAAELIQKLFCTTASNNVRRVILLAPNHFGLGGGWAISGKNDWQTVAGSVPADSNALDGLLEKRLVSIDDRVFSQEHGIGNLLPAVKNYFPNAAIIPIIVKNSMPVEQQEKLAAGLAEISDNQTIVIASLDFSHDLSLAEANRRDAETLPILTDLNYNQISGLNQTSEAANVDSQSVLGIFLRLMARQQATQFELLGHSNSAIVSGQMDLASTTSYFTAVYRRKK